MQTKKSYVEFDLPSLRKELLASSRELFLLKHKKLAGELKTTHLVMVVRRKIADIKRLIHQNIKK